MSVLSRIYIICSIHSHIKRGKEYAEKAGHYRKQACHLDKYTRREQKIPPVQYSLLYVQVRKPILYLILILRKG